MQRCGSNLQRIRSYQGTQHCKVVLKTVTGGRSMRDERYEANSRHTSCSTPSAVERKEKFTSRSVIMNLPSAQDLDIRDGELTQRGNGIIIKDTTIYWS